MKKKLWKLLESHRPDALKGLDQETVTVEQLLDLMPDDALDRAFAAEAAAEDLPTAGEGEGDERGEAAAQALAAVREARVETTQVKVRRMVEDTKLPALTQKRIQKRFEDRVATQEEIQAAIDEEREYLAALSPARPRGVGHAREGAGVQVGAEKIDRLQAAFDRAMGLEPENEELRGIAPLGLRGLYEEITGGYDENVRAVVTEAMERHMTQEAFTNATLPRVVANTMHRRLLREYAAIDYRERDLITVVSASDFRTREAIRVGGFGDIPDVDPEAADYAEIAAFGDSGETYSVGQKGGLVTISRKSIINDDVGALARVTTKLGRAARRTFAKFVYDFLVSNPVMSDGNALFSAPHANLGSVALSVAELVAADVALYSQTEPDSGEILGLELAYLWVPKALEQTAIEINQSALLPGSPNNDANRWHHHFGEDNERIVTVPFFADANDFVVGADPMQIEMIEVAFLNGQEEPELWLADAPTVGEMLNGDRIQYKIRHEYGGTPVDHRGLRKNVVV